MTLQLSATEQANLVASLQVLLSPLSYASVAEWRRDVHEHLKRLVDADACASVLPVEGEPLSFSDEVQMQEYAQRVEPLNVRMSVWQRAAQLRAFSRNMLWAPYLDEYYRSAYYNDYALLELRSYQAVGIATRLSDSTEADGAAQLILYRNERNARPFPRRTVSLLRLVQPAYAAGVDSCRRMHAQRAALTRTIDSLPDGLLVCDRNGAVLHASRALIGMLHDEPQPERLQRAIERAARQVAALHASGDPVAAPLALQRVVTGHASYSITGAWLQEGAFDVRATILVTVQRVSAHLPPAEELQHRFQLTRQEAVIARRLAAGESNKAIAAALALSPHTVRRHTESIFRKLGVSARAMVAQRLAG